MHRPGDASARSACWATTTKGRCSIPRGSIRGPSGPSSGRADNWRTAAARPPTRQRAGISSANCRATHQEGNFLFVHGSARNPLNEYVFPEDIYNRRKLEKIFALVPQYAFQGHTHVPGVFTEDLQLPQPRGTQLRVPADRAEGDDQRRLGRPAPRRRSSGVLRRFWRTSWCGSAASSIRSKRRSPRSTQVPELDNFLGDRLRDGR